MGLGGGGWLSERCYIGLDIYLRSCVLLLPSLCTYRLCPYPIHCISFRNHIHILHPIPDPRSSRSSSHPPRPLYTPLHLHLVSSSFPAMHLGGYFDSSLSSYSASGSTSTSTYASPSSTPATSTSSHPPTTMAITTTMVMGGGVGGSSNGSQGTGGGGGSSTNGSTQTQSQRARPRGLWKARATPAPRPSPENKFPGQRGVGGEFSCCQHRGEGTYGNGHRRDAELRGDFRADGLRGDPRGEFPYPHHSLPPSAHHHLSHQSSSASHHHHYHHQHPSSSSHPHSSAHPHQHSSSHAHPSTHTHLYPIAYDDDCLSCSGDYDDWSSDNCASSTGSLDHLEHSLIDSLLPDHLLPDHEHYHSHRRASKKRRLEGTENSNTPPTSDEEVLYWDYSRRCSPHPERLSKWITRSKVMDTSSVTNAGGEGKGKDGAGRRGGERKDASVGPAPGGETAQEQAQTTCDLEDWEDLKELFAKAAEMYENQPPSEAIPLLRGVIHECHRFLRLYYDPSVIYATPLPPDATNKAKETPPEQRAIRDWLADKGVLYPPGGVSVGGGQGRRKEEKEKKCKCKDLPTSFYTILGTTLFFFGNLLDQDPALAYPGEPSSPTPYWLSALDVFEIGENLPIRTSGRGCPSAPEDWRMAIVWGRTLVCLAHEVLARENEKEKLRREQEKNGESPATLPPSSYPTSPAATTSGVTDPFAHLSFPFSLPPQGVPLGAALGGISGLLPSQHLPTPSAQQGASPDEPVWPPNSPFALIVERRLPRTRRMTLTNTSAEEMMVVAKDQFSRGIFHMPHPLHYLGGRARRVNSGSNNNNGGGSSKEGYSGFGNSTAGAEGAGYGFGEKEKASPAVFSITPPLTAYYSSTLAYESSTPFDSSATSTLDDPKTQTQTPTQKSDSPQPTSAATALLQGESFSRAKELFTIASEVLDVAERFPTPSSRAGLAAFADGILSQMKLEANTERTGGGGGATGGSHYGLGGGNGVHGAYGAGGGDGGRGNAGDGAMGYGAWAGAGAIVLARGRANLVIGTARAEEIEERLEALEEEDDSDDDADADDEEGGKDNHNNKKSADKAGDDKHADEKKEKAERKRKADEVWECDEAVDGREALGVAVVYLEKAREALGAWVQEEERAKASASASAGAGAGAGGSVGAGAEEDEEIMVVESEDGDGDEEEYEMDEDSDADDAEKTSRRAAAGAKSTTTTTTTTTANTTSSSALMQTPPSPAETIEEIGMMLAEALVTLANLTRDKREREVLYARAQRESGDAIVLDEEEDGMDI